MLSCFSIATQENEAGITYGRHFLMTLGGFRPIKKHLEEPIGLAMQLGLIKIILLITFLFLFYHWTLTKNSLNFISNKYFKRCSNPLEPSKL